MQSVMKLCQQPSFIEQLQVSTHLITKLASCGPDTSCPDRKRLFGIIRPC